MAVAAIFNNKTVHDISNTVLPILMKLVI